MSRPICLLRTSQEGTWYLLFLGTIFTDKGICILGNSGTRCGSTGLTGKAVPVNNLPLANKLNHYLNDHDPLCYCPMQ